LLSLLGSFRPLEWTEEEYVEHPPFILEGAGGKVFATATSPGPQAVLDRLSEVLGLKKRKQGRTYYYITKGSSLRAFNDFEWIVRKSWRDKKFAVFWAIVYLKETRGWTDSPVELDAIAEVAGCGRKQCATVLEEAIPTPDGAGLDAFGYRVDRQGAESLVRKMNSELPSRTEEIVMRALCSSMGGSASEVYERVMTQGLGLSATYKTLEKLKKKNHVHSLKHYRVNDRGPMRELLAANCGSCFYGYASPQRCLTDTLRQLETMLRTYYGKTVNDEEKDRLRSSINAVPYSSKLSRRVVELLTLVHQVDQLAEEGGVSTVLSKIEESYEMEFPLRRQQSA